MLKLVSRRGGTWEPENSVIRWLEMRQAFLNSPPQRCLQGETLELVLAGNGIKSTLYVPFTDSGP